MRRRTVLRGCALATPALGLGIAGCGDERSNHDYDPELARIVLINSDDVSRRISFELYELADDEGFPGPLLVTERAVEIEPDGRKSLTDVSSDARRFELRFRVDDRDRETARTAEIQGCSEIHIEIAADGSVAVTERTRTVCYAQDD